MLHLRRMHRHQARLVHDTTNATTVLRSSHLLWVLLLLLLKRVHHSGILLLKRAHMRRRHALHRRHVRWTTPQVMARRTHWGSPLMLMLVLYWRRWQYSAAIAAWHIAFPLWCPIAASMRLKLPSCMLRRMAVLPRHVVHVRRCRVRVLSKLWWWRYQGHLLRLPSRPLPTMLHMLLLRRRPFCEIIPIRTVRHRRLTIHVCVTLLRSKSNRRCRCRCRWWWQRQWRRLLALNRHLRRVGTHAEMALENDRQLSGRHYSFAQQRLQLRVASHSRTPVSQVTRTHVLKHTLHDCRPGEQSISLLCVDLRPIGANNLRCMCQELLQRW